MCVLYTVLSSALEVTLCMRSSPPRNPLVTITYIPNIHLLLTDATASHSLPFSLSDSDAPSSRAADDYIYSLFTYCTSEQPAGEGAGGRRKECSSPPLPPLSRLASPPLRFVHVVVDLWNSQFSAIPSQDRTDRPTRSSPLHSVKAELVT